MGVFLLVAGVVIGMGVAWMGLRPDVFSISMIVLALVFVAVGLGLATKFRAKDDL